jgi:hypothetical protein
MEEGGAEMLYNEAGKLTDQLANGMPKSHMGNPGLMISGFAYGIPQRGPWLLNLAVI